MWTYGREQGYDEGFQASGLFNPIARVGCFTSTDGVSWQAASGPGPLGSVFNASEGDSERFDSEKVGVGSVTFVNGCFVMWYSGTRKDEDAGFPLMRAGVAVSRDGLHWIRGTGPDEYGSFLAPADPFKLVFAFGMVDLLAPFPAPPVDAPFSAPETHVDFAEVQRSFRPEPGRFRMYYNSTFDMKTVCAVEAVGDTIVTLKTQGVASGFSASQNPEDWDCARVGCVCALRVARDEWWLFYEGHNENSEFVGIGLARSADGVIFVKHTRLTGVPGGPVLGPGPEGAWDDLAVGTPYAVLLPDRQIYLYYIGINKQPASTGARGQIGLAVGHIDRPGVFEKLTGVKR